MHCARNLSSISAWESPQKQHLKPCKHKKLWDSGARIWPSKPDWLCIWNSSVSNWFQIMSLQIQAHHFQTKHAKSYNYLIQNISIVLFCADIFECLLYYFRYKVLSKTICFHPLLHSYIPDSCTKFPIDLISSLTNCCFYFSEVWSFPTVDFNLSDVKESNERNDHFSYAIFNSASDCVSASPVCGI